MSLFGIEFDKEHNGTIDMSRLTHMTRLTRMTHLTRLKFYDLISVHELSNYGKV